MIGFTKERIEQFIKKPLEHGLTRSEQMEMARQLLAGLEQEPVGDVVAWHHLTEERTCDIRLRRHDLAPGPLYAAPQLPQTAVPDEVLKRIEHEANHVTAFHHIDEHSCKVNRRDLLTMVNAFRAAMIQGAEPAQGWIPCSERMPLIHEKGCEYQDIEVQAFDGEQVLIAHYAIGSKPKPWGAWVDTYAEITHWQPLAAAPQQEVKSGR